MTEIPTLLQNALDARRRDVPPLPLLELSSARIARGDIRFVTSFNGPSTEVRLALVLSVDTKRECAEVILVHTAVELACDFDGVVRSDQASAQYDLVIETDLRAVVWSRQLAKAVGHLDAQVMDALGDVAVGHVADGTSTPHVRTGLHLAGPADPRWAFKRSEGEALRRLSQDCTEALLDDATPWVLNPSLLRPNLLSEADDPSALVSELMNWLRTRPLSLIPADDDELLALGIDDVEAWAAVDDLGSDVWTALQGLIETAATAHPGARDEGDEPRRLVTAAHLDAPVWNREPTQVHVLGQKEAVAA
jgi:hypothetical protein